MEVSKLMTHPKLPYIIASSSYDESVKLWNIESKVCIAKFAGFVHSLGVFDIAFNSDGTELLSSDGGGKIAAWNFEDPVVINAIQRSRNPRHETIEIHDCEKQATYIHNREVDSICYLNNDHIVSKSACNDVIHWSFGKLDKKNHEVVHKQIRANSDAAKYHRIFIRFAVSPIRRMLVVPSMVEKQIFYYEFDNEYDAKSKINIYYVSNLNSVVRMFDFSPDEKFLIAGTASREIHLFRVQQ